MAVIPQLILIHITPLICDCTILFTEFAVYKIYDGHLKRFVILYIYACSNSSHAIQDHNLNFVALVCIPT